MRELKKAVLDYAKKHIDDKNDWYRWKINEAFLPEGIDLPKGNPYKKNIALKKALNEKWQQASTQEEYLEFVEYYVAKWGGIRGNKNKTLGSRLAEDE